jgi:hypothetical protein
VLLTPEDREAFKHMEELQLAIDDPMAWETMQIEGDLERLGVREVSEEAEHRGSEQDLHRIRGGR